MTTAMDSKYLRCPSSASMSRNREVTIKQTCANNHIMIDEEFLAKTDRTTRSYGSRASRIRRRNADPLSTRSILQPPTAKKQYKKTSASSALPCLTCANRRRISLTRRECEPSPHHPTRCSVRDLDMTRLKIVQLPEQKEIKPIQTLPKDSHTALSNRTALPMPSPPGRSPPARISARRPPARSP